jgi:hypothetical protein
VGDEPRLADIGRLTGMTKEGVRLWEATVLAALRRIIWQNDYTGWRCRFTDEVRRQVRDFLTKFSLKNRSVFLRSEWSASARDYFNVGDLSALVETRLLIGLARLTPFRFPRESTWTALSTNDAAMPRLQQARALINKTLNIGCPDGLPLATIHEKIAQGRSRTVSLQDVRCLLSSLPDIKYNNKTRRFRVCQSKLRLQDALEQTLRAAGEPVSLRVFQQRFRDEDGRPRWTLGSIVTEIAKDRRFVPVGLTGKRALREWAQIERRSIADIAAEIVQSASAPVSEAQLFAVISKRRSLSFGSIRSLLLHDRRFRRVSPGWWAPAA